MAMTDSELQALVAEAIYKSLDEKKREELIRKALESLLKPSEGSGYGHDRRSQLEKAYESAVWQIAHDEVKKRLIEDVKIREVIGSMILKAFDQVLKHGAAHDQLVTNLAGGIANAFKVKDYD